MFVKDILLFDFEGNATGGNLLVGGPSQLSAILLDKKTLEEKKSFSSYINFDYDSMKQEHKDMHAYTREDIMNAPSEAEVGKMFMKAFGNDVLLACWVTRMDFLFLERLIRASGAEFFDYDYHYLDLWPITYLYLLKHGYKGGIRSEEMFQAMGIPKREKHDGLSDCRFEAEILRKIVFEK